jgi:hypothetical protein
MNRIHNFVSTVHAYSYINRYIHTYIGPTHTYIHTYIHKLKENMSDAQPINPYLTESIPSVVNDL